MKRRAPKHFLPVAAVAALLISWLGADVHAQILFPATLTSRPADTSVDVYREQGRKGLLFHFKFFNAANVEDDAAGFPLNMATATVTLTIGANPALACTAIAIPAPGACGYQVVAGTDDPALDTVKTFYNGDFPAGTQVRYSVTGARSAGMVPQSGDPNIVTFTTGNVAPRDPASIELVFDISGSMSLPAVPNGTVSRMDALKSASQVFFNMLDDYAWLNDKIGLVYFSTDDTVFDPTSGDPNLELAQDSAKVQLIANSIQAQVPTNSTSIGAGLQAANTHGFAADPPGPVRKKSVVLFSDGEQNAPPNLDVVGQNVQINGANYNVDNVCPITAGVMTAPGFDLQQKIANAKCGTLNAHILANQQTFAQADLETHFLQLLTNFLVGDKVELVRDLTGKISRGANIPQKFLANASDTTLSLLLSWSATKQTPGIEGGRDFLPFRLIAPNGTQVDLTHRTKLGRNASFTTVHFPLNQNGAAVPSKGEWTVELVGGQIRSQELNYHLVVLLDNPALASDYRIEANDIGTGEAIPLHVQITDGGTPLLNATVTAELLGPDNGVGNILSREPTPSGTPNPAGDVLRSAAQGKLLLLSNDPQKAALFNSSSLPTVTLLDNGQAVNGDTTAGDGIYSALFRNNQKEGHYQFRITVRGTSAAQGDFQRTRTLTVFVRPKANAANTLLTLLSSAVQADGSVIIRLSATPRDAFDNFLGPDYLGNLKILSSEGTATGQLEDKLNGSYEISYRLPSANSNPIITLEVTGTTVVTKTLSELQSRFPRWLIWLLILLALILIIIWLLLRHKKTA
jgi:von Willebrand factor type A domain